MLPLSDTQIGADLQLAIERDELALVYQPKIQLSDGSVAGVEALLRWHHPVAGAIDPATFVSIAERSGLVDGLTEWVLRAVLRQWRSWCDQGLKMNIAFNVSALSLRDMYLPDYLQRCCQQEGVPTEHITVEVTESATQHVVRLLDTLTRIRLKGVSLALDDFGTGYSSLLQLRQLPYSELKIDQSFVRDAPASNEACVIIRAIVDLARGLGLRTTAEGVETLQTLKFLSDIGCDQAQGFVIAKPMKGPSLASWILKSAPQWRARLSCPKQHLRLVSEEQCEFASEGSPATGLF